MPKSLWQVMATLQLEYIAEFDTFEVSYSCLLVAEKVEVGRVGKTRWRLWPVISCEEAAAARRETRPLAAGR